MVKKFIKFIEKSPRKELFLKILEDIANNHLRGYDIKAMQGKTGLYRLRHGSVRFIFRKTEHGNMIVEINNRGDIY